MTQYLPIVIASAVLAFLVTPLTRWLARRWGMVDQPGIRKAHRDPTPLLGGMALFVATTLGFLAFGKSDWLTQGLGIWGGGALMFFTGLWDDRWGMSAKLKMAACVVAALFASAFGVRVLLWNIWWLDTLITVLWIVGITNAANLMDNMDGLAAGLTLVAATFFFALASLEGQGLVSSLAAALMGASIGFLFYNLPPAVSFMGDSGSLTLGFILATLGIQIRFTEFSVAATWMAPIVVLGVFIFDTTLVTISRLRRGRSPFQGGSDHTSHRLTQLGLSKPRAVLTLYVAAGTLGALAIMFTRLEPLYANVAFWVLLLIGLAVLFFFERIEPKLSGEPPLVLFPGSGGLTEAARAALSHSPNLTILLTPQASRAEVIELLTTLAEHPAPTHTLLSRGLGEAWWQDLPAAQQALKLHGVCVVVSTEAEPPLNDLLVSIKKAKLIIVGPGESAPALAVPELRAAVEAAPGEVLWAMNGSASLTRPVITARAAPLTTEIQRQLLLQAAGHIKSKPTSEHR
ncbi:MAG: undecaprenyl/decaprenyl-phosphate alpha-N-acetylglucosaminyl 1-phosphate transferase [Anaerolineales bacterium]|nr:undecaprenyl/decaprenyl-phosphate alpha-N-acetylglucosaminyl 1-phosphate transferase [Anaerolineales bacterium]